MKFKIHADIPVGTKVYKKVYCNNHESVVLTMIVTKPGFCPATRRCSSGKYEDEDKKCRVREAFVLSAEKKCWDNKKGWVLKPTAQKEFYSGYNDTFKYTVHRLTGKNKFDRRKNVVCTDGIHCFLDKKLAARY